MTYFADTDEAVGGSVWEVDDFCFCCNEVLSGPLVSYDGFSDGGRGLVVWMHSKCAFEMAQRMICDYWPNRMIDRRPRRHDIGPDAKPVPKIPE